MTTEINIEIFQLKYLLKFFKEMNNYSNSNHCLTNFSLKLILLQNLDLEVKSLYDMCCTLHPGSSACPFAQGCRSGLRDWTGYASASAIQLDVLTVQNQDWTTDTTDLWVMQSLRIQLEHLIKLFGFRLLVSLSWLLTCLSACSCLILEAIRQFQCPCLDSVCEEVALPSVETHWE